ncbi:hypothetical protein [Actinoplanes sp. N902-109]|uniref:hypothetical protein n=1 Tax=Actinoplanes sp. (strain N902-109) TaxID=649831 RepID=UPI0012FCEF65|nr:hypothetical protein [Actinoplanes sp. N902-109]
MAFSRGRHRAERSLAAVARPALHSRPIIPVTDRGLPISGPEFGRENRRMSRWGTRRRRGLVTVGTLGAVGMLAVPLPVSAAPASCDQAERYAAQSGSQILRINSLGSAQAPPLHVGDARSALVAPGTVNSAAVARMLDVKESDTAAALTTPLQQQAPPTNAKPARRSTPSAEVGPVSLGDGKLSTQAQWQPGMACGATVGEVTQATARLREAGVLADGEAPLVHVPKVESGSSTELERDGDAATSVASAGLTGGGLELLGGAVKVRMLKPPSLRASMSTADGGEVRYIPAVVEVSGAGVETSRLDTAGDSVEITLAGKPSSQAADGASAPSPTLSPTPSATSEAATDETATGETAAGEAAAGAKRLPATGADTDHPSAPSVDGGGSTAKARLLGDLPAVGNLLGAGDNPPLPDVPDLPTVEEPATESAPTAGSDTVVHIELGDVRQASEGHAVAARAAALSVQITEGNDGTRTKPGYGGGRVLDFDMGVLEAAAVAPETAGAPRGGVSGGSGGGLPITGPTAGALTLTGLALVLAGAIAVAITRRSRPRT